MPPPASKSDHIIILGAGIFGLSTALHLLRRGYTNITIFDKQPYETTQYDYFKGCDAASADTNKIIRSAYGSQVEYQTLTLEALEVWRQWNEEIANAKEGELPEGMTRKDRVFVNNGNLVLTGSKELPEFERATIRNMEEAGYRGTQLVTTDNGNVKVAKEKGLEFAVDPFQRKGRGKGYQGVLDTTGGMLNAAKACRFALHKAKSLGAKLKLGAGVGEFKSFLYSPTSVSDGEIKGEITGIITVDGKQHYASRVVVACGGWTPSILPQLDGLCETTAGSIAMLKIPRESKLWHRLSPEKFPTYTWRVRDGTEGGIYGFPRDEEGWLKIGYRGTKYTNPKRIRDRAGNESERSVPVTKFTKEEVEGIPKQAFDVLKGFLDEYLPELKEEGIEISVTRLCWYTDSFDNHFVIDKVPGEGFDNVIVATGGSGHAFKSLPVIGKYVADVMEGADLGQDIFRKWQWRTFEEGEAVANVLMEGSKGPRALNNVAMVKEAASNQRQARASKL